MAKTGSELNEPTMHFGSLALGRCKYGWMLYGGAYIGKCFELYGQYSESEVAMMSMFLREGSTVIDVGANIGDLTVPIATVVGESGRVYAIESHPETFKVLCANLALNELSNVLPINAFVAPSPDVDTGSAQWGRFAFVSDIWPTQFISLDSIDLRACDLLKIDVDGNELEVLMSGEMQIERFRPVLYLENDVREKSAALLEFLIEKLGYDLYWHPAPIFDPQNFFGNSVNHWAPQNIVSLMVLGVPRERGNLTGNLQRITDKHSWWR